MPTMREREREREREIGHTRSALSLLLKVSSRFVDIVLILFLVAVDGPETVLCLVLVESRPKS